MEKTFAVIVILDDDTEMIVQIPIHKKNGIETLHIIANNGILASDWFYPAHRIKKVRFEDE